MLKVAELNLGFNDAENYYRRENRSLFNKIFIKNEFLDKLLSPSSYFLIGEKGTGKTAYAVFLSINNYKETIAELKYIRETDYQKFVTMKQEKHLQLSDYSSIWKVIILLLIAKSINKKELDHNPLDKIFKLKSIFKAIDDYYLNAFSPEILSALNWIEDTKVAAELISKYLKFGEEQSVTAKIEESSVSLRINVI